MKVFVHGVPETAAIWDRVRSQLGVDSIALSLPGFGCERPVGFGATMDDYAHWVLGQLDDLDEPVDLVGHDWGAGITYRIALAYGDRLRSWAADVANIFHPDTEWHRFAKIWQTPGEGERFFAQQAQIPLEDRATAFEAFSLSHDDARTVMSWADETMAGCILDLYRSATPNVYAHWPTPWGPTSSPGMVLFPTADPFGDLNKSREVAAAFGARHESLEGAAHFWPLQAPDVGAAALTSFWEGLD